MWLELMISSALELGHPADFEMFHLTESEMAEYFQMLDPEKHDGEYKIEIHREIEPRQSNDQ